MLPIGAADSKTLHPPSSTLHAKETIFGKAHAHIFKCTHGRFSTDSSRMPLPGTSMDFTQIFQSFNNLCQPMTSADPLPQEKKTHQVFRPAQKRQLPLHSLLITFCHLFSLYSIQVSRQCYSSSSPALPHQPAQPHQPLQVTAQNTQLLLQGLHHIWTHALTSLF